MEAVGNGSRKRRAFLKVVMFFKIFFYFLLSFFAFHLQAFPEPCDRILSSKKNKKNKKNKKIQEDNQKESLLNLKWKIVHRVPLSDIILSKEITYSKSETTFLKFLNEQIQRQQFTQIQIRPPPYTEENDHIKENDLYLYLGDYYSGEGYRHPLNRWILNFKQQTPEPYKIEKKQIITEKIIIPTLRGEQIKESENIQKETQSQDNKGKIILMEKVDTIKMTEKTLNGEITKETINKETKVEEKAHSMQARTYVIQQIKEKIEEIFDPNWRLTLTAIPSSKSEHDPRNDQRFNKLFEEMSKSYPFLKFAWPVLNTKSTSETHIYKKLDPGLIKENYTWQGFKGKPPGILFIFDDILTTGSHFRAVSDFLRENGFKGLIIGVFLAQAVRKNKP